MWSAGGSKWTTQPTASTWMPRAATSVATRARTAPEENCFSARSRCGCDLLPWMATADTPAAPSWRTTRSAPCLVRQKTMAELVAGDDVGGQRDAARRVGLPEQVADLAGLAGVVGHLVAAGLVLVAADDAVDVTVERGREQHGLTLGRR